MKNMASSKMRLENNLTIYNIFLQHAAIQSIGTMLLTP